MPSLIYDVRSSLYVALGCILCLLCSSICRSFSLPRCHLNTYAYSTSTRSHFQVTRGGNNVYPCKFYFDSHHHYTVLLPLYLPGFHMYDTPVIARLHFSELPN